MAYLLGIDSPGALAINAARGQLFETFAASELKKAFCNSGRMDTLYFWRSVAGHEVDAIIEKNGLLHAVEMKSGRTIGSDFFSSLLEWEKIAKESAGQSFLVYGGDEGRDQGRIQVLPWRSAGRIVSMCD
jgi:predicted AAA+ superfamily ATPase